MKKLAKIEKARLEIQERHILMFYITVNYEDGFSQNVGGLCLDDWNKEVEARVGTAYGCEMIRLLLLEIQVNDFSEMAGKHIWVHGEGDGGFSFKPTGIQSLECDNKDSKPLMFKEVADRFKEAEK